MKTLNKLIAALLLTAVVACDKDADDINFVQNTPAPTDVSAKFQVSTDNSGQVTITPFASAVSSFLLYFGDGTTSPTTLTAGQAVTHTYPEGNYQVKIVARNTAGKQTEASIPLQVAFQAPQNPQLTISNDQAVSNKINLTAKADYAITYEVLFGETTDEKPTTANIGEPLSYVYQRAGNYTITVQFKGAAKQTTTLQKQVQAIALQQPTTTAPKPPMRQTSDVQSLFSDDYTNVPNTNFNPNWGQATTYNLFSLDNNQMLQYTNLNYQGIQFAQELNLSNMDALHLDVWTADATELDIFLISKSTGAEGEKFIKKTLTSDNWTSIDIPLTEYTKQGFVTTDVHQIKLVGKGTIFIDNLYFYKKSSNNTLMIEDFEGNTPAFTAFGNMANPEVVVNPHTVGNPTSKVAKMVRNSGSETWAGAFFTTTNLNMKNYKKVHLKALSPKAGIIVKVKLENAAGNITKEVDAHITQKDTWQDLSFDFSSIDTNTTYTKFVIFFDFGETGDGSTYYCDQITLSAQ